VRFAILATLLYTMLALLLLLASILRITLGLLELFAITVVVAVMVLASRWSRRAS